jgi:hypothetical protein
MRQRVSTCPAAGLSRGGAVGLKRRLDEAIGLAIGFGRIGPCPNMLEVEIPAGLAKAFDL